MGSMLDCQDPERAKALDMLEMISGGFTGIDINEQEAVFNKPRLGSADPIEAENADHRVFNSSPAYFFSLVTLVGRISEPREYLLTNPDRLSSTLKATKIKQTWKGPIPTVPK
jgi:hypothetical protein